MDNNPTNLPPAPAPETVDWDYEMTVPTNWYIRGKNPTMHLLSDEQIEALSSSGNPWPLALFTMTGGIAAALLIQLKSGVVDPASKGILWAVFYPMVILTMAFGVAAVRDYFKTRRMKQTIKHQSPTAQAAAPTLRAHTGQR